jgi:hypothetical protein
MGRLRVRRDLGTHEFTCHVEEDSYYIVVGCHSYDLPLPSPGHFIPYASLSFHLTVLRTSWSTPGTEEAKMAYIFSAKVLLGGGIYQPDKNMELNFGRDTRNHCHRL